MVFERFSVPWRTWKQGSVPVETEAKEQRFSLCHLKNVELS